MTPTEIIVESMETFAEKEPKSLFMAWIDEEGNLTFHYNCDKFTVLGMVDFIREQLVCGARTRDENA